jgi:general secretion pathway protein N
MITTKSKVYWLLLAVALFLVFVIVQIPASWGGYLMTRNGALALSGVSGSVWHGRAGMASVKIDGRDYLLGELRWDLQPLSLLTLTPCAELKTDHERQQITGTACTSLANTLTLRDTDISVPASLLQGLPEHYSITGQLSAHIEQFTLKQQSLQQLQGNLSWSAARLNNGQRWLTLGAFAADLSATDSGELAAEVFSLEGPVDLKGTLTMALSGGVNVDVEVALTDAFKRDSQADQWLPLVATPLDNGRHKIQLQW